MRERVEVTLSRSKAIKVHIIKAGTQKPYCGTGMTDDTKIITYAELMRMDMADRVCGTCIKKEFNGCL